MLETAVEQILAWVAPLGITNETELVRATAGVELLLAFPTIYALLSGARAAYGRYFQDGNWGPVMNGKAAWIIQESPCILLSVANVLRFASSASMASLPNRILLGLFVVHYVHRTLVFPLFLKGKPTPVSIMLMAFFFCVMNGYIQSTALTSVYVYDAEWLSDPRFLTGVALFFSGMAINLHSDYTLLNLRKPGETGYKIPRGGMFEYVSGANFFGEITEWLGFAIACWSFEGFVFAFFTFANIAPRGIQHHKWYKEKFDDYPPQRRGIIPFLW